VEWCFQSFLESGCCYFSFHYLGIFKLAIAPITVLFFRNSQDAKLSVLLGQIKVFLGTVFFNNQSCLLRIVSLAFHHFTELKQISFLLVF